MTGVRVLLASLVTVCVACAAQDVQRGQPAERAPNLDTDSMGVVPTTTVIRLRARSELVENSAATLSATQPGIFFTLNDSGSEPLLFAFDSTGADRGMWRVTDASNDDWESASTGPCSGSAAGATAAPPRECVYIGDTGDNGADRPSRVIYRIVEPGAERAGFTGEVAAEALVYRYEDGPHDVEAMYVAPNADTYLITKRSLEDSSGRRRPSLVFRLPADAWRAGSAVVAALVDSLPVVPGSAPKRQITDAALSPDGRHLAVRTYAQVYVFATDSATGRVRASVPPGVCNIGALARWQGEGVAWFGRTGTLLLTNEGRRSPMFVVGCPVPAER